MSNDEYDRAHYIEGLRMFAQLLEDNPEIELPTHGGGGYHQLQWLLFAEADQKERAKRIIRTIGGTWDKNPGEFFHFTTSLAGLNLEVSVDRAEVCERVVTGTREVTRTVPDPTAPLVEVVEVQEIVTWLCGSILAPA